MISHRILEAVQGTVTIAQETGALPSGPIPEGTIEHPQDAAHGDYACTLPLKMARTAKMKPLDIANIISERLPSLHEIEKVEVAHPGFINFTLKDSWLAEQTQTILDQGNAYGNIDIGRGARVQLEFVSVNPTGPLHVGHGRGAVLGSALANMLSAAGYTVEREYYINDAGGQIDVFRASLGGLP
jgi:arginyl-tRNA synthetase